MIKNAIVYLIILTSVFVFSIFYYNWFSWFLLIVTVCVPIFSLIVSLPFMIYGAINGFAISCKNTVFKNESINLSVMSKNGKRLFCPLIKLKLKITSNPAPKHKSLKFVHGGFFGEPVNIKSRKNTLSNHCGCINVSAEYCKIYDFTGIFFIPVKIKAPAEATVIPKPTKPSVLPDSELLTVTGYKSKPGGGYSDYYELRSYRNGDSLKQIHWKLSGKYDNIIVRSPSVPIYKSLVVQIVLSDNADINDDILARFIYASNFLCKNNTEFYACASISNGLYKIKVFEDALDFLRMIYRGADLIQAPSERESSVIYAIYGDKEEVVTG